MNVARSMARIMRTGSILSTNHLTMYVKTAFAHVKDATDCIQKVKASFTLNAKSPRGLTGDDEGERREDDEVAHHLPRVANEKKKNKKETSIAHTNCVFASLYKTLD